MPKRISFLFVLASLAPGAERLDLAPFAKPCCAADTHGAQTWFDYRHPAGVVCAGGGRWVYGLEWAEERDLFEVRVRFHGATPSREPALEYWFQNWPYDPPRMPTIEDPVDDPWQGSWIAARTQVQCARSVCSLRFLPLEAAENKRAANLPGVSYRRAIKFRLLFPPGSPPEIERVQVFSESTVRPEEVRVRFLKGGAPPRFRAYNGTVRGLRPERDGAVLKLDVADPRPPGSNDVTVVEVKRGADRFSFSPADLDRGPVYVPGYGAYITRAEDRAPFSESIVKHGARTRERLAKEPEQTYERAAKEIPPLDPVERQGGRLYLPLAADASWQKFALEWGGNVSISKSGTKAMGRELARLAWPGDRISWRIGTGDPPGFRPASGDSTLSQLEDHLPVAAARWTEGPLEYEEEAFATLLSGPLAPDDAERNEQTPAVLLVKITARNRSSSARSAHWWLGMQPAEPLAFDGKLLTALAGRFVRAAVKLPAGAEARMDACRDTGAEMPSLHVYMGLRANQDAAVFLAMPFVPELSPEERQRLSRLDHGAERSRVVAYWRGVTENTVPFRVPEERFNSFAKGLPARIRISATKDPSSGLYMVPAASYSYKVFANEASFQSQLLDVYGQHKLAAEYLETLAKLQGSKPFDGSYTGDQKEVYHGARVDADYDYTASQYNLDHGTVLWTLGQHYLYTRDREWLRKVAPGMKRAADWIVRQRALTRIDVGGEPCPEYGLLPGGHLEDNSDWGHWFSVNAYASAGMTVLAQVLQDAGDADAAKYRKDAEAYRSDLRAAVLRASSSAPVIRLRDNTYVPYVPTRAHQRIRLFGPLRVA